MTKIINILNLSSFLAQSIARLTEEKNVAKFITVIVFVCNSPTPYDHLNVLFLRHFRLHHIYFPLKCKDFHSTWPVSRIFRWRKLAVRVYFFWSLVRVACRLVRFPARFERTNHIQVFRSPDNTRTYSSMHCGKTKNLPTEKRIIYYRAQHTPEYVLASVLLCTLHRKNDIRIPVHKWEETRREKWPCRGSFWRLYSGLGRLPSCTYRLSLWK